MTLGARRIAGPFECHIRDAISLNRARAPVYAAASHRASRRVSSSLIRSELLLLPVARWFDRADARYVRGGVPLLEHLFEPMPEPAALDLATVRFDAASVRPHAVPAPGVLRTWYGVRRALRTGGFEEAARALHLELEQLQAYPATDCMRRHMLESARRIATMAPELSRRATTAGLADPSRLLRRLLGLHLWGVPAAARLDRLALPVQRQGVPILQYDLPSIAPAAPGM